MGNGQRLITVDLGKDAERALEAFNKAMQYGVGNAAGDAAIQAAEQIAEKTKAEVDMIILMVEDNVQMVLELGASALYEALGIDESTLTFAKNVVSMAEHATDIAGAAVLKGMATVNSIDMHSLPMSAAAASLLFAQTFVDAYINKMVDKYGILAEVVIQAIVDPNQALEMIVDELNIMLQQIEELIDEQLEHYLGMSLVEIKYYCTQGIQLYKQYKEARKRARAEKEAREASGDNGEQQERINTSGKKTKVNVDVEMNPDVLMANLKAWMDKLGDGLYNGFIVLQVLDAVKTIREAVKQMTDISLESLASDINSLEDLIEMLDEIGLGDDSTAVDLSLIPSLGINDIMASLDDFKQKINEQGMMLAGEMAGIAASSVDIRANVSQSRTYDISTDAESKTITITYYTNPTEPKVSKKVYKALSTAKNSNKQSMFLLSECKSIQDATISLWNQYSVSGSPDSTSLTAGKYTIVIQLQIEDAKEDTPDVLTNENSKKKKNTDPVSIQKEAEAFTLLSRNEERTKDPNKVREQKRNTIKLLHTVYSIIKSVIGPLNLFIVLISNYKINKAYVREKHDDNLFVLIQQALGKLGLNKEITPAPGQKPEDCLYPVRSIAMLTYVDEKLQITFSGALSRLPLADYLKRQINAWLDVNDKAAPKISDSGPVRLFIDFDSIAEERACIKQKQEELKQVADPDYVSFLLSSDCAKTNGTFNGIDKIEFAGDKIIYSDSDLPRMPSQIMTAQSKGYKG